MSTQGIDMLLNSGSSSTSGVSSRNATDGMPPELLNVNAVSVSERMQQLILQCQNTGGNPTTADFKDLAAARKVQQDTRSIATPLAKRLRRKFPVTLLFKLDQWHAPGDAPPATTSRVPFALSSFGLSVKEED